MNSIWESSDPRSPVQYHELLKACINAATKYEKKIDPEQPARLLTFTNDVWAFDVDALAQVIASHFRADALLFEPRQKSNTVSIHFGDLTSKQEFSEDILKLQAALRTRVVKAVQEQLSQQDIRTALQAHFSGLERFLKEAPKTPEDLRYANLTKTFSLKKQRLHLRAKLTDASPRLKGHKLFLQADRLRDVPSQIAQGILSYLQTQEAVYTEQELADTQRELARQVGEDTSDLARIGSTLIDQSLARLQRTAQIHYLAFLAKEIQTWNAPKSTEALPLLRVLENRLRQLETYMNDPEQDDLFYQLSYQDVQINLRKLLSRANAFDALPIVPRIGGLLGETYGTEQAFKTFTFGVKLKLNGAVHNHGGESNPVFIYYTDLFDPESKLYRDREKDARSDRREKHHWLEKMLSVAFLYLFVFGSPDGADESFPQSAANTFLAVFKGADEAKKRETLHQLAQTIRQNNTEPIRELRTMLVNFLHNPKIGTAPYETTLLVSLKKELLVRDPDSILTHHRFFQDDWEGNGGKDLLKYVSVDEDSASTDALCRLPVMMQLKTMYYDVADQGADLIRMSYMTESQGILPIAFTPYYDENPHSFLDTFLTQKHIRLVYRQRDFGFDVSKTFVYRLVYMLFSYLFLKLILEDIPEARRKLIFLPLALLHTKAEKIDSTQIDAETFIHSYGKVLAHLLAEDYQAGSQGFNLQALEGKKSDQYKRYSLPNALSSLYNVLPRRFHLQGKAAPNELEKLAILTVSSRVADRNNQNPDASSLVIYGDVVGMERQVNGELLVKTLTTFSDVSEKAALYDRPDVLLTQIRWCYQQGYRHFFYVARAPYTSTLKLPSSEVRPNLYFMNETVLHAMRQIGHGIKIYPVFFDTYSVVQQKQKPSQGQQKESEPDSLYIDDLEELDTLAFDKQKHTVIFLNVFNGQKVGPNEDIEERVYNGVVSYSTLVNMYEETTYYQYIWQDLLGKRVPGSLSTSLLDWLSLLHFLRYEKSWPDRFKLNPYGHIIGSNSVGADAILPHMSGRVQFNSLALLSVVRSILHAQ